MEDVKKYYIKINYIGAIGIVIVSFVVLFVSYVNLYSELQKQIALQINNIEYKLNSKISFYKSILENSVDKIEKNNLHQNTTLLHRLIIKNHKILIGYDNKEKTLAVKWIGNYPYNFNVDYFGVHKTSNDFALTEKKDAKGIISKITNSNNINVKDKTIYKLCNSVISSKGITLGNICIDENLYDFLLPYSVKNIQVSYFDLSTKIPTLDDIKLFDKNKAHIKVEVVPKVFLSHIKIIGYISKESFYKIFFRKISNSLGIILTLGVFFHVITYFFYRNIYQKNKNIGHQIDIVINSNVAILKFKNNLERRLYDNIDIIKKHLDFCITNKHSKSINLEKWIYRISERMQNPYYQHENTGFFDINMLENQINDILLIFNELVRDKNLSIQYKISNEFREFDLDGILFQSVLGSMIKDSIESLQKNGTIKIEIQLVENNDDKIMRILLQDNGFGVQTKIIKKSKYSDIFLGIRDISEKVKYLGGAISSNTIVYSGKKIEVILPLKLSRDSENVINIFK